MTIKLAEAFMNRLIYAWFFTCILVTTSSLAQQKSHRTFGLECASCHTTASWKELKRDVSFEHKVTGYILVGEHKSVSCAQCHDKFPIDQTKKACLACHRDQHNGEFGDQCQNCHSPHGWRSPNEQIARHQTTRFPLVGAHLTADCKGCHSGQQAKEYSNTPTECYACHAKDFSKAAFPDHEEQHFDHNCMRCHEMSGGGWGSNFIHPYVELQFTAAHKNLSCADCHVSGFKNTPRDCYGCHQSDYAAVKTPNHAAGNFNHDCTQCHDPVKWKPARFNHAATRFPLEGKHASLNCTQCHTSGLGTLPSECWSCHEKNFSAVKFPDHATGKFNHDCTMCHSTAGWKPAKFEHDLTKFPLTGKHRTTECQRCHINGNYANMPLECQGCHEPNYRNTTQPNHLLVGFTMQCQDCHSTSAWQPVAHMPLTIDHDKTRFALVGKHRSVGCEKCHVNNIFRGTFTDCFACHQSVYLTVKNPNHAAAQFNHDCTICHSMNGWKPATVDHDKTAFPLRDKHATVQCERCHVNGVFTGTPKECYGCHEKDFAAQKNPDHAKGAFDHDCTKCHTTKGWKPAQFDHAKTRFGLSGKHAAAPCEKCHVNGQYSNMPLDCYSCHRADFDKTKSPSHATNQFPHDCTRCHDVNGWKPSTFDHAKTQFTLEGKHRTTLCEKCHVNGQYTNMQRECFACHQADFTRVQQPNHTTNVFPHECAKCHDTNRWKPATFDHARTHFPLQGAHATKECNACHKNGDYAVIPSDCWSCHQKDYQSVTKPNHVNGQFNHDCTLCHSVDAFKPTKLDHAKTRFPLTGKHTTLVCEKCHVNGQYGQTLSLDCFGCHQNDFNQVKQPDHALAKFDHDCTKCHATNGWKPSTFDHATTKFALTGKHTTTPCQDCHTNGNYALTFVDCYQCHQSDFNAAQQPNHTAGKFNHDCTQCHSTSVWKPATFDHASTKFPLAGKHATALCERCHTNGNYALQYTDCLQCHQMEYDRVAEPNHALGKFDRDCAKCHTFTAWKPSTFDHGATKFALTGKHKTALCSACHTNGNYTLQYTDCYACHQQDYQRVQQPNHVAGKFDHDCGKCHNTTSYKPVMFDHATTKFPLSGAHITTACEKCHVNGNYSLVYNDCFECHQTNFNNVQQPNHVAGKFDHDCTKCHTTTAWKPTSFDHATTKFPLTGTHITTECSKCHVNGNYAIAYVDCYQCHVAKYNAVTQPNHIAGKFDHKCEQCHTTYQWKPAQFNHASTNFPLEGAHVTTPCERCHTNGNYQLTYTGCFSCHESKFNGVQQPNHVAGKFDHDCTKCHTSAAWKPAAFNHAQTNFPLTGAHIAASCEKCHVNGNYQLTFTDCYQCHDTKYAQATNPNHVAGKFNHDCTPCHTTTAWKPSSFNHAQTGFPLIGAHVTVPCQNCHVNGNYQLTYTDCWQCHESTFNAAANPPHASNNFPHDCTVCHGQSSWKPSTFNHNNTAFPLVGAHATKPCGACHVNGNYQLTYVDCWQCHQSTYNGAANPNHVSNQFPHDCLMCHSQNAWKPSTFNHANTSFPLVGAHVSKPCVACHVNGNYQLTYVNCWQCHQSTYNGAMNPNHVSNQFPHDCLMCHTQNGWQPSTFNHANTNFPLVGAHTTKPCISCHVNGNYQLTYVDCWQCHQTTFNQTTNPNHATNQFPHDCLQCHTQNAWVPSTFNHNNTNFPLVGAHQSQPCINCHVNGNYQLTYTDCYQCHQPDFNAATNPNHVANQFSHNCTPCHSQTAWKPSTFNHNNTAFPLQGAHTSLACNQCHINGNYQLTYTNCYQCHQTKFAQATSPANHVALNLSHTCTTCHNQTSWNPANIFRTFHNQNYPTAFPIYNGSKHNGKWNNCNQCHTTNNVNAFCCTQACHTNQSGLANDHNGVSGYTYTCTSCVTCHPDGKAP